MKVKDIFVADPNGDPIFHRPIFSSKVPAGFPSPADDYIEQKLDLNEHLVTHPAATFFVRVEGHSMKDAGINSGDILVVDRSVKPIHGKVVVAILHGEFTVKRLSMTEDTPPTITLIAENDDYPDIPITEEMEFSIWGVVTSVIHNL